MQACVRMSACVICSPVLKDSEPCETSPLDVGPGCSKCLFMCEGGECTGGWVVSPFVGASRGGARLWLSLTLPEESTAEGTGFQPAEGSALLFVFDQKKKKG